MKPYSCIFSHFITLWGTSVIAWLEKDEHQQQSEVLCYPYQNRCWKALTLWMVWMTNLRRLFVNAADLPDALQGERMLNNRRMQRLG
jgi:hypothetical protein